VDTDAKDLADAFADAYRALYSRIIPGVDIEIVSWALSIQAPADGFIATPQQSSSNHPEPSDRRSLFDAASGEILDVPVYRRAMLKPGAQISGPAIITEDETSTVISTRFDATINGFGYIELRGRS
jgi:N-methylhydantoinase A